MAYSYKVRRVPNGKSRAGKPFINFSLTVPPEIAEIIPEGMKFDVELTDEGILYRVTNAEEIKQVPEWAQNGK